MEDYIKSEYENLKESDVEKLFKDKNIELDNIVSTSSSQLDISFTVKGKTLPIFQHYNSEVIKMYWHEAIMKYIDKYFLRKCPFCGSDAGIVNINNMKYFVRCKSYCCETETQNSESEARWAWNKRAD